MQNTTQKKFKNTCCLALFLLLFVLNVSYPQQYTDWKWQHPKPQGNLLRWVKMFDANTWYAVGSGGTFMKTTNAGTTWYFHHKAFKQETDGYNNSIQCGYFLNQSTGFVGGLPGLLYKTTNAGSTFDSVHIEGFPVNILSAWFNINFLNGNTGYIAGTGGKYAVTTNGGNNWVPKSTGTITTNNLDICAVDTNIIYVSAVLGIVKKTTDGGLSWVSQSTGTSQSLYSVRFLNKDTGCVSGNAGSFRYTTNGGLNWITANPPSTFIMYCTRIYPGTSPEIFVTGDPYNIYKTTNFGANWIGLPLSTVPSLGYFSFDKIGTNIIAAGTYGLLNSSVNNGVSWNAINSWVSGASVFDIYVENNDGRIWTVGSRNTAGSVSDQVMFTSNGGLNWSIQNVGNSTKNYNGICMLNSSTGYICGTLGIVRKTINGGASWDSLPTPITNELKTIDFINPLTGWVFGTNGTVLKTTDGGSSWEAQSSETVSDIYSCDIVTSQTGWYSGNGWLSKTTNGGTNWMVQPTDMNNNKINCVDMIDTLTGFIAGDSCKLRKTTNGGISWNAVSTPVFNALSSIDFIDQNTGFIAGTRGFTAKTTNCGVSWDIQNTGALSLSTIFMKRVDSAWCAGNAGSVFKYAMGITGGINYTHEIPLSHTLEQNYPNPFNPVTTIKFGIHKAGNVTLKVYDITGREVKILIDNIDFKAGTVTYNFDGSELASGVYFYSLIVNSNKIGSKKMLLVK